MRAIVTGQIGVDKKPYLQAVFDAAEMPQALDLCTRENVPWGFTSNASLLHFAVASGPAAIAPGWSSDEQMRPSRAWPAA